MKITNKLPLKGTLLLILFIYTSPGIAFLGNSNLGYSQYPSHSCNMPITKPCKPFNLGNKWEVEHYNHQVERYNKGLRDYIACINTYVEASKNDINDITTKANAAINEANYI